MPSVVTQPHYTRRSETGAGEESLWLLSFGGDGPSQARGWGAWDRTPVTPRGSAALIIL
jgi:hypothetical protein